jgi:lipopolysaccharide/colanic/teichoic acid biosynthesis glycosyltransferase
MYEKYIKRAADILLSLFLILIFIVPLALIALAVVIESPGGAIFKQQRLGKNAETFTMYKLRSMRIGEGSDRVTRLGRFIRATSIDELPQLFNVLKGDMSLIGPRPILECEIAPLDECTDEQRKRFSVLPGITGWAAVNGRRALSLDEKIVYDNYYVDHLSALLDLKILIKTVKVVLTREGNSDERKKTENTGEKI